MKIVLFGLNGSFSHTNLAIRCLREPLERDGFSVTLLENTLRDRDAHVLERLWREQGDIYGFSCYIWNLEAMLPLAEALHRILPRARIVLGGPEVSYETERFDKMDWIDAIVCGEGENAFLDVCRAIREGRPFDRVVKPTLPCEIGQTGILYRDGDASGGILYYESSRGCPYSCAYCLSSATQGVRMKSVAQTLADMEAFERLQADTRIVKFVDRTFNADVGRANAIWEALLDERFTKHYHFEVCATLLNEESFAILSRFPKGKIQLEFGLQSTNPQTLAAVSRHIRPETVIHAVSRIRAMGNIHVHLDLIAGLPYEDYQSFSRSFDAAYGCADLLQLGFLKLLCGTELRERREAYGYQFLPKPPYTVLQSRWISYGELQRLSRIAEVLERYLESGRFAHALWYLEPLMRSPFAFWEGLSLFLEQVDPRPLQRCSQPDAFRYLLQYGEERVEGCDASVLRRMLAADFSEHEHKNPPAFLR
ncbi:MAG: DUF4080 domain-containing protein [Clostridia bacterium]|nr:DUF4080 domain-containing protein [Clostridia bacterium]